MTSHHNDIFSIGVSIDTETIIQQLQDVLERYSSQDIVREIVQNADDAGAGRLVFFVLETGIPASVQHLDIHPLLRSSAILVLNDGPLKEEDIKGIARLIGGSKQEDSSKVGRFGLGLKSLFHVCEAFFFGPYRSPVPHIHGRLFDPWIGIRKTPEYVDRLPQWTDEQTASAYTTILKFIDKNYGDAYNDAFFIYVPFRSQEGGNFLTIKEESISSNDFIKNFCLDDTLQQLVLSFAQCSSLQYIEFFHTKSLLDTNKTSIYKFSIKRDHFLRRPSKNDARGVQSFKSTILLERVWKLIYQ